MHAYITELCMYVAVILFDEILDNFSIYMLTVFINLIALIRMNHTLKKTVKDEGKRVNNNYHIFTIQGKPELLMEKELWILGRIMQTYFEIFHTINFYALQNDACK